MTAQSTSIRRPALLATVLLASLALAPQALASTVTPPDRADGLGGANQTSHIAPVAAARPRRRTRLRRRAIPHRRAAPARPGGRPRQQPLHARRGADRDRAQRIVRIRLDGRDHRRRRGTGCRPCRDGRAAHPRPARRRSAVLTPTAASGPGAHPPWAPGPELRVESTCGKTAPRSRVMCHIPDTSRGPADRGGHVS